MNPTAWQYTMVEGGFTRRWPDRAARLLNGIVFGVAVDFEGERATERTGPNLPIKSPDHATKITAVIAADCAQKKKAGPLASRPPGLMVSPIGAVPKKDPNKIRVIHHLSYPFKGDSINEGIEHQDASIQSFGDAAIAVRARGQGCWLIKLDVEAAYKQVPVRREDWHLLGFEWQGAYYYERVLPFGLKSSCRIWDEYAFALHEFFVELGVDSVVHYIDDFLFVVADHEHARSILARALRLCEYLGIPMAPDKTEGPTTCLVFLGIEIDTVAMRARLPDVKLADLRRLTAVWGMKSYVSIQELQSMAGVLSFAAKVVRPGRAFIRSLFTQLSAMQQSLGQSKRHAAWAMSADVRADVAWWHEFAEQWNGHSLLYEKEWTAAPVIELFTDACGAGYGAVFGSLWFESRWSDEQKRTAHRVKHLSMPWCELFALVTAAATWAPLWAGKKITFRSDCQPVVFAIGTCTSSDPPMQHLLRQLVRIACEHSFDFRCEHIAGVRNVVADVLSRDGDCPQFRASCPQALPRPSIIKDVPCLPAH